MSETRGAEMQAAVGSDEAMTNHLAIHEAGHAVANVMLDLVIDTVTIVRDGTVLGCVTSRNPTFGYESTGVRDRESQRRDHIRATLAGRAAEHVLCGEPFTFDEVSGSQADHHEAWQQMLLCRVRNSAHYMGDDKYDAAFERLQREALQLVRRHASAIQRVAAALIAHPDQTLTGADVQCASQQGVLKETRKP